MMTPCSRSKATGFPETFVTTIRHGVTSQTRAVLKPISEMYLCIVYLTTLSVAKTIISNCEMINEYELKGMWKEAFVA
jgi:hypothetical protein